MEEYLYDVSKARKTKLLDIKIIEQCKELMNQNVHHSTRRYFEENEFFQELPPNLRTKLIKTVLYKQM